MKIPEKPAKYGRITFAPDLIGKYAARVAKESARTKMSVQQNIDYSYDVVNDFLNGESKGVRVDLFIKTCMDLHIPLYDILTACCAGDLTEHMADFKRLFALPYDVSPPSDHASGITPSVLDTALAHADANHTQYIDRVIAHYQQEISMVHSMYDKEISMLMQHHANTEQLLSARISDLERQRDLLTQELFIAKRRSHHPHQRTQD